MTLPDTPPELEPLLEYLKRTRGFDFTAYKRSSLNRRIRKRMQTVAVQEFAEYIDYLEVHPEEFPHLFNTILINVTGFFRDAASWQYLASEVLPRIVGEQAGEAIRVWSAGCASGQEAYSIAILLAEILGVERFRQEVKIYATDVDEEALSQARQATYTAKEVEDVPPGLLAKYFERTPNHYVFNKDLRRAVIFGRHDLVQDAPISRIRLLVCRNTLMYLNSETQARILARFHYAMNGGGVLFLGKAEMLLTHGHLFVPIDLKHRVFAKVLAPETRALLRAGVTNREEAIHPMPNDTRLRDAALESDPVAQMVTDGNGVVTMINERARTLFGLTADDVGRPLRDLSVSYRPADLRTAMEEATTGRRPVVRKDVAWEGGAGGSRFLDITVLPLLELDGSILGVKIAFADVTPFRALQDELTQSKQALETAYEELQSSNEELETTNEELQSSNEELETTNEELQSTNEELETMNEELQSTNEELETINTELRQRTDELNDSNGFLASILSSLRAGVAVVDHELKVLVWNDRAADLWGLRPDEAQGRHFMNLDIGLPVAQLRQPIRSCLAGEQRHQQMELDATNRRGRQIRCTVTCMPLDGGPTGGVRGVILLMATEEDVAPPGRTP
jgi:two-component system CheB/CheR fusion protein